MGHGVRVAHAELAMPALDQPIRMTVEGAVGALPVSMAVNVLRLSGTEAMPFQALALADGGTVSLVGSLVGNIGHAGGVSEMTVSARMPDVRRAGALAGVALPGLTDLVMEGRVAAAPNGPGLLVRGLRMTAVQGDLGGDMLVRWSPRPLLRGSLVSQRLDLDAVLAPVPVAAPAPVTPLVAPAVASASAPRPLPFAALRAGDADVRLAAGAITWHGGQYRALQARVLLQDGRLRVDPAQVLTPGGSVEARMMADAAAVPPTFGITVLASGLDAAPLAAAAGVTGAATGTVDLDVDLRGAGAEWAAMAPTLDGHAGVALVNGDVENQVLRAMFGGALRAANLPTEAAGRSRVRCFALKVDVAAGHMDVRALALDASRARLDGEGSVNLVDQTVDLHLRPVLRLGSTGVAVPVHLAGPWRAPKPELERGAISPGRVGLSILGGGLGGGAAQPDLCGPALATARGNRPGMAPQ